MQNAGALAITGLLFAFPSAKAASTTWTGSSASWDTPVNWSEGVPTASGTAVLNNGAVISLGSGVSGAHSFFHVGNTPGGSGAIEINGGELAGSTTYLGHHAQGSGTATITSGTWNISTATIFVGHSGQGVLSQSGGSILTYAVTLGNNANSNGSASITGGSWATSGVLAVGNNGTGSMVIDGGNVSAGSARVGGNTTGHGSITVTSGTISGEMSVGYSGTGSMTVNGGHASSINAFLGQSATGDGTAVVTSGTWSASGNFYVGSNGKASLEVNGGKVSASNTVYLAHGVTSVADLKVTSGTFSASWLSSGSGTASMTVEGGSVSTTNANLGGSAGGKTDVTVKGGTWSSTNMYLGSSGTATFAMQGGELTANSLMIGGNSGGDGTLTVTSGTVKSPTSMNIGSSGKGVVEILGGVVQAKEVLMSAYASGNGSLKLSGSEGNRGVLETSSIQKQYSGAGTASLAFDGGILRAQTSGTAFIKTFSAGEIVIEDGGAYIDSNGYNVSIASSMGGTGALTKQGAGALTLSASNSYSGGTVVDGGAVVASANHALGTGSVTVNSGTLTINSGVAFTNSVTLGEGASFDRGFASGASLAGAVNLSSSGDVSTTATIVGGISSGTATLKGSFSMTSIAINDATRSSDVFHLSGFSTLNGTTGETDVYVLQLQVVGLEFGRLGWLDESQNLWVNAVDGNIGGTAAFFNRAYNADTDFVLGRYGFDAENGTVWAVLNHNSEFAVVPEPGTWALLLLGGGAYLGLRMRRRSAQAL